MVTENLNGQTDLNIRGIIKKIKNLDMVFYTTQGILKKSLNFMRDSGKKET